MVLRYPQFSSKKPMNSWMLYRILGWFALGRTFKDHPVQPSCHGQECLSPDIQSPIQPDLEHLHTSIDGASATLTNNNKKKPQPTKKSKQPKMNENPTPKTRIGAMSLSTFLISSPVGAGLKDTATWTNVIRLMSEFVNKSARYLYHN